MYQNPVCSWTRPVSAIWVYIWACLWDTTIRYSHKHAIYVPKSSVFMSTTSISADFGVCIWACLWDTSIRDSHKHAIYVPKSNALMSTTSISGFWCIFERANMRHHNTRFSKARHMCTKIQCAHEHDQDQRFWCIFERAYETPQYEILISTPYMYQNPVRKSCSVVISMLMSILQVMLIHIYWRAYENPYMRYLISTLIGTRKSCPTHAPPHLAIAR
jgi:hypothetical protein